MGALDMGPGNLHGRLTSGSINAAKGIAVDKPVKITIASDPAAVRQVQDRVLHEMGSSEFDQSGQWAVKLALEESLMNAIKHGNKSDAKKKIHVEYKVSDQQVDIAVEDEGPGFAREGVPDPTLDENIEKCSGRGILLIEAYMTNVHWTRGGRRVHMTFVKKQGEAES
jgi:serine/threonine-protein kinase RsbW